MPLPTNRELREMLECGHRGGDVDLMLIAPQLAEEVIRLREEVDMMADFYRRMRDVAAEKFVRTEEGSTNASTLGFLLTLYTRVIDRLERIKEGGDE